MLHPPSNTSLRHILLLCQAIGNSSPLEELLNSYVVLSHISFGRIPKLRCSYSCVVAIYQLHIYFVYTWTSESVIQRALLITMGSYPPTWPEECVCHWSYP